MVEIDLVFGSGPQSLGFSVSINNDFVFVRVVEIDMTSVSRIDPLYTNKRGPGFKSQSALTE